MAFLHRYQVLLLASLFPALSLSNHIQQAFLQYNDIPLITFEPSGTTPQVMDQAVQDALQQCAVRSFLNGTRYRIISSKILAPAPNAKSTEGQFQSTIYDYDHARSVFIDGTPSDLSSITVSDANAQPVPNADELQEAAKIAKLHSSETIGLSMPPVLSEDFADGTSHRILKLALTSEESSRIVHVNMNNSTLLDETSRSMKTLACTAPPRANSSSGDRNPGTMKLQISRRGSVLWTFEATRPSGSSGTRGSGIELKNVKYKGKTLLNQAHVPILNVEYDQPSDGCGPHYRDWQYAELPFQCTGQDLADGFRMCSSPAQTIIDSGVDGGNFHGVGIYVQGAETVLVSQLEAGWYRYITEWRFHENGTLRPIFGFGAVLEGVGCVCKIHRHHAYWRLDFDIGTSGGNVVREFNNPPIMGTSNYHDAVYEVQRPRDASHSRHWEVSNVRTGDTYGIFPGSSDGPSDAFGVGDVWVLRYNPNELDDGVDQTGGTPEQLMAHIDKFMNGESVRDQDVVVWYAGHFRHDQSNDHGESHRLGPELRPLRW